LRFPLKVDVLAKNSAFLSSPGGKGLTKKLPLPWQEEIKGEWNVTF
jgi:hypothetical protein